MPGLPPVPVALLPVKVLLTTVTFSSCVPMAPPFDPLLPVNVLPWTMRVPTPWPLMAPPDTSCPVDAHCWLFVNVQSMTVSDPPSSKILSGAPLRSLETSCWPRRSCMAVGQREVLHREQGVGTFQALLMWEMRVDLPPLDVTSPPPSIVDSL